MSWFVDTQSTRLRTKYWLVLREGSTQGNGKSRTHHQQRAQPASAPRSWSSDRRHLATRTNTSVVISSLHDHDRGQAEGVRAAIEVDPRLATRSGLFDHPANAVLLHAEHCLDDGHRGHHHEIAGAVDAVKLVHFSKSRWPRCGFVGGAGACQPMECNTH